MWHPVLLEVFVDGGLFEILIASAFAWSINFIFRKKILLIAYAALLVLCPIILFLQHQKDIFYVLLGFVMVNNILLVILLFREQKRNPGKPLFSFKK